MYIIQVHTAVVNSKIHCCHAAYEYNSISGVCEFIYSSRSNVILREDRTNKKYIYIRVSLLYKCFLVITQHGGMYIFTRRHLGKIKDAYHSQHFTKTIISWLLCMKYILSLSLSLLTLKQLTIYM